MEKKTLYFLVLLLVLIVAWVGIFAIPKHGELVALNNKKTDLEMKERTRISQMDIQILRARVDSLDTRLNDRIKRLYPGEALLQLGETMERLGKANGLKLVSIAPDYTSLHLFREKNNISDLPVTVIYEGTFSSIGRFLDQNPKFPFVFRINEISIDKADPEKNELGMTLSGVMVIGNRLESEAAAATKP